MAKRSRIDIIFDMLESIQKKGDKIKPTHLMYKSNLSYRQMSSYLEELIDKQLVAKTKNNNYEYLIITDRGHEFLEKLREMKEFEITFGI